MARRHGRCRCRRGERLRVGLPHGHWKTTTFITSLRMAGSMAPMVLDGRINRIAFEACVEQVRAPQLSADDIVIMDNLGSYTSLNIMRGLYGLKVRTTSSPRSRDWTSSLPSFAAPVVMPPSPHHPPLHYRERTAPAQRRTPP